jgi:membrane protein YdbS with pleckstrin-like domain
MLARGRPAMSYVSRILQPGEVVLKTTKIHWFVYVPGVVILVVGIAIWAILERRYGPGVISYIGLGILTVCTGAAAILLAKALLERSTTEIAATDRRIIYKRGIFRRHTIEMEMDKVESVDVDQTVLGRIFNFGDITIRGVGIGLEPLRHIEAPLDFRSHVTARRSVAA